MAVIEAEFATALKGKVKRKRNATGKLRAVRPTRSKASGAAAGAPEVMVKITGYGKGGGHLAAHLGYTSRNSHLELETDKGEILSTKEDVRDFVADWKAEFGDRRGRKNQRDTMHAIFSMPPGTPSEAVRSAVRNFTRMEFGRNHEYAFVLHSPENDPKTNQPHCHVAVKCRGVDGRRLSTNPEDVQRWREGFAEAMRKEGVDCEATSRTGRGIVKKPIKQKQLQMAARGAPNNYVAQARHQAAQAAASAAAGKPVPPSPWEIAIAKGQARTRTAWMKTAAALVDQAKLREEFENRKVKTNERQEPSQRRNSPAHARTVYLLQSGLAGDRGQIPASALAGLRDVSRLDVVRDKDGPEVLLHQNARSGVGAGQRGNSPDHGMRRERDRNSGPASRGEQLTQPVASAKSDRALAAQITAFVGAMPSIHTRQQEAIAAMLGKEAQKLPEQLPSTRVADPAGQVDRGSDPDR